MDLAAIRELEFELPVGLVELLRFLQSYTDYEGALPVHGHPVRCQSPVISIV